jgi:hypothetical protein
MDVEAFDADPAAGIDCPRMRGSQYLARRWQPDESEIRGTELSDRQSDEEGLSVPSSAPSGSGLTWRAACG